MDRRGTILQLPSNPVIHAAYFFGHLGIKDINVHTAHYMYIPSIQQMHPNEEMYSSYHRIWEGKTK